MITTIHINESELDMRFIKALKAMFKNKDLTLTVETASIDETEYLARSEVNKQRLLKSVQNVNNRVGLTEVDINSLKTLANA